MTRASEPGPLFETASDSEANAQAAAAAAPDVERGDSALLHTVDSALHEPLYQLLCSIADNKYVLGRRYAEWCTGAPMLESAVAAAAMAQDELGHARSFYPLLRAFPMDRGTAAMEERGWQTRRTSAMACLDQPFRSWADYTAANLLVDTALTTLLGAATASTYEPLRQRARKILQEETTHWVHATGWLRRLADAQEAVASMWDDAFTWFGKDDDPCVKTLAAAKLLDANPDQLRVRMRERLEPVISSAELLERPLPWERWDAAARRLRAAA